MYSNPTPEMLAKERERDQRCTLSDVGVTKDMVDALFFTVVRWLKGTDLPWTRTQHLNVFKGPENRHVVELLFYHYDGPVESEISSSGPINNCKMYLYDDHMTMNFIAESIEPSSICGLNFKYSSRWFETNHSMMGFLTEHLSKHLKKVFESTPRRFDGSDEEIQMLSNLVDTIRRTMDGDGMMG